MPTEAEIEAAAKAYDAALPRGVGWVHLPAIEAALEAAEAVRPVPENTPNQRLADELIASRARIRELEEMLRGEGANRYWEGRWRDAEAQLKELHIDGFKLYKAEKERLCTRIRELEAAIELCSGSCNYVLRRKDAQPSRD